MGILCFEHFQFQKIWKFSKCHNFFSSRQIDLKICMWSYFLHIFCFISLTRLLDVHFSVFCHNDPQNVTNRVSPVHLSGPSTEKSWTPCERSSKIMGILSPNDFWNVVWMWKNRSKGVQAIQSGGPPRFSNVAPQRRFGRRVLRTMKESASHHYSTWGTFPRGRRGAKHSPSSSK